jgi:signal transduction histidine kinase
MNTIQPILQDRRITYLITDHQLKIDAVEDAAGIFADKNCQTLLGSSLLELIPELIGSEGVLADILTGQLPRFELPWVNYELTEGRMIFVNMVLLPFLDSESQITGLVYVIQDVSEIGEIHQQLSQHRNDLQLLQTKLTRQNQDLSAANTELRRMNEIKANFVSMAAHELNTPLSSIVGYVEMLLDDIYGPLSTDQREPMSVLQRSGQRLKALVNDLLDVTRIQAERIELVLQPIVLRSLVESVIAELKPQLDGKAQDLTVSTQPDLPFALIDETRSIQIVSNLISNASKYSAAGSKISISLAVAEEEGFLQLSVADKGVGISREDQTGLFKQFFRAESARSTGATGTGLGLFITRSLVELQGGHIWFESELKQGSTFYVTFPTAGRPTTANAHS